MGRVGTCADNAAMESFFSLLQKNVLNRRSWPSRQARRLAIVTWIENTYHRRRRQDALSRLTHPSSTRHFIKPLTRPDRPYRRESTEVGQTRACPGEGADGGGSPGVPWDCRTFRLRRCRKLSCPTLMSLGCDGPSEAGLAGRGGVVHRRPGRGVFPCVSTDGQAVAAPLQRVKRPTAACSSSLIRDRSAADCCASITRWFVS